MGDFLIGVVLIILGLRWLNVLRVRTMGRTIELKKIGNFIGAFMMGIPFSMSFCPFCTPILLSILSVAAATGKVWYSAALMVFFSLGRGLPFLIAGLTTETYLFECSLCRSLFSMSPLQAHSTEAREGSPVIRLRSLLGDGHSLVNNHYL